MVMFLHSILVHTWPGGGIDTSALSFANKLLYHSQRVVIMVSDQNDWDR